MKHLSDDEVSKELETLKQSIHLSADRKEYIRQRVFSNKQSKRIKNRKWLPTILSFILITIVFSSMFIVLNNDQNNMSGSSIVDLHTPEKLPVVIPTDDTILIDWWSDSMDRGNHDFLTSEHGKLVVDTKFEHLERGLAVYYKTPPVKLDNIEAKIHDMSIGRVVGLPGETIEIKMGQVYIDGKMLDSFYGKATMHGLGEDEYFTEVDPKVIVNEKQTREYFNTNMSKVTIEENSIFILTDQWWRGIDSRYFGGVPTENVKGIITGYKKN